MKRKIIQNILLTFSLVLISVISAFSQTELNEPWRFYYQIWGNVTDEKSKPMANVTVCFLPAERPINGRVPCAKTYKNGNYLLGAKEIPDKYVVIATTGDSFVVPENEKKKVLSKSTEPITFGAKDERRNINFQLTSN